LLIEQQTGNRQQLERIPQCAEEEQEAAEESKGEISANKTTHLSGRSTEAGDEQFQSCMSPGFLVKLLGELRNNCRKPQGRRWSEIEKTLAASMFHRSLRLELSPPLRQPPYSENPFQVPFVPE